MRLRGVWVCGLGLTLAVAAGACGGGQTPASESSAPPAASSTSGGSAKIDPATAADIKGTVTVDGTVPANARIGMNADPICARQVTTPQMTETYVVGADGKTLGNVFVYVKDGLGNYVFDPPKEPARIDQKDCRYHPHVFGMQVGQPLEITNSDSTLHNIHAMAKNNREFNTGQPIAGHEDDAQFHGAGSDGPVQVRRPRLDERLCRRAAAPVFRGHGCERDLHAEVASARHVHD